MSITLPAGALFWIPVKWPARDYDTPPPWCWLRSLPSPRSQTVYVAADAEPSGRGSVGILFAVAAFVGVLFAAFVLLVSLNRATTHTPKPAAGVVVHSP